MHNTAFVVDMGGTSTRVAVVEHGAVLDRAQPVLTKTLAPPAGLVKAHLDAVAERVQELRHRRRVGGRVQVGVAIGATVSNSGLVTNASMLWGSPATGLDVVAELERRIPDARVHVSNDINAAAWRYRHLGRFAVVTVSTGVAIKVFDDRLPGAYKLLADADGLGGESGHLPVSPDRPEDAASCECGELGDLCAYTSGPGMVRAAAKVAAERPQCWRGSHLHDQCGGDPGLLTTHLLATAHDDFVDAVLLQSTKHLAVELLRVLALLGLRRIVVSGGIPRGFGDRWYAALTANMVQRLPESAWFTGWTAEDVQQAIVRSADDDDALLGIAEFLAAEATRSTAVHNVLGTLHPVLMTADRERCGPEQFEIAVRYGGICGTDRQIVAGDRGCQPGILGHEAIATVLSVGSKVTGVTPGDVVTINPNHPLDDWDKLGHNQPGLLRQYATLSDSLIKQGRVIALPPSALNPRWVLIEPLACVMNSIEQACGTAPDLSGKRVLVAGAGVAALLHGLACRMRGAEQVLVTNRSPQRLRTAHERGILDEIEEIPLGTDTAAKVLQLTDSAGVDVLFLSVSEDGAGVLKNLWPSLAPDSTACLFGGFGAREVLKPWAIDVDSVRRRGHRQPVGRPAVTIVGTSGARRDHFLSAAQLLADSGDPGKRFGALITHEVALNAAPGVLHELATSRTVGGVAPIKVVVDLARTDGLVHRL